MLQNAIHEMPALAEKLANALVDDPPLALKEGGIFRDGYDADLDELRQASREGKNWISAIAGARDRSDGHQVAQGPLQFRLRLLHRDHEIESRERARALHRKQTTVGGERFITPELKEMEAKILGADERAQKLEYQLFQKLRDETLRELAPIQQTADAIATLDVLCALAETARLFGYCRPVLNDSLRLVIQRWAASGARSKSGRGKIRA